MKNIKHRSHPPQKIWMLLSLLINAILLAEMVGTVNEAMTLNSVVVPIVSR